jgi:hypothetical protein
MLDVFIGNKMDAPVRVPRPRKDCHIFHNTGLARDGQPSFFVDRRRTIQAVSGVILYMLPLARQKEPSLLGAFIFHKKDLWKDSSKLISG